MKQDVLYRDVVGGDADGWYLSQYCMSNEKKWDAEGQSLSSLPLGIYEVTQFPNMQATQEQEQFAAELIGKVRGAVKANGWLDKHKALSDGYEPMWSDGIHYANKEYLYDGITLDPEKPEFLMFYDTPHGELLMGVMFGTTVRGRQFAGPLSVWHFHKSPPYCYAEGIYPISEVDEDGECEYGEVKEVSVEMMHLWLFEHPQGAFATQMYLLPDDFKVGVKQVLQSYQEQGVVPALNQNNK